MAVDVAKRPATVPALPRQILSKAPHIASHGLQSRSERGNICPPGRRRAALCRRQVLEAPVQLFHKPCRMFFHQLEPCLHFPKLAFVTGLFLFQQLACRIRRVEPTMQHGGLRHTIPSALLDFLDHTTHHVEAACELVDGSVKPTDVRRLLFKIDTARLELTAESLHLLFHLFPQRARGGINRHCYLSETLGQVQGVTCHALLHHAELVLHLRLQRALNNRQPGFDHIVSSGSARLEFAAELLHLPCKLFPCGGTGSLDCRSHCADAPSQLQRVPCNCLCVRCPQLSELAAHLRAFPLQCIAHALDLQSQLSLQGSLSLSRLQRGGDFFVRSDTTCLEIAAELLHLLCEFFPHRASGGLDCRRHRTNALSQIQGVPCNSLCVSCP
mmetsp:Transcript_49820/g.108775  ORF Transcript_49820/g.108775 Transcript_49820/m.108775 type:complete len:385 (-) Transcript_49820:426-1580(-)